MWCINPSLQRWTHNWESSGTTAIDTQRCGKKALLFCGGISPHPWILWAHWIVSWIWKWCESYAMAFSQSPDLNPTEHLWINLDWHVWQRSCRVIQSQCIFKHLTKTLCVAFSVICHPSICSNVNSCFNDITDEKVKQSVLLFYLLLSFSQLPSSFSLSLFLRGDSQRVKMEALPAGHMSDTQACAAATRTHTHMQTLTRTHADMYELQWEEVKGKRAKKMGWDTEREEPLPQRCNGLYLPFPPTHTPSTSLQSGCVQAGGVPYHIHCTHSRGFGGLYVCGGRCRSSCTLWCWVGTFKKILCVCVCVRVTVWWSHLSENERTCSNSRIHYSGRERNKHHLLWQDDWQLPQMYF